MHKHACERAIPAGVLTALLIALIAAAPASGQTVSSSAGIKSANTSAKSATRPTA